LDFWRNFWRRGTHVNIPKLGSRGEGNCLGEFWWVYAVLRRELCWGNLKLDFFKVLVGVPRGFIEEGGHYVCISVCLREFLMFWGCSPVNVRRVCVRGFTKGQCQGRGVSLRGSVKGEGFTKGRCQGRGVSPQYRAGARCLI
jgi:hypothetical protein